MIENLSSEKSKKSFDNFQIVFKISKLLENSEYFKNIQNISNFFLNFPKFLKFKKFCNRFFLLAQALKVLLHRLSFIVNQILNSPQKKKPVKKLANNNNPYATYFLHTLTYADLPFPPKNIIPFTRNLISGIIISIAKHTSYKSPHVWRR